MSYYEITPHENNDYDTTVMPADTEEDHHKALAYAQDRLESLWDSMAWGVKKITVTMELKEGEIPEDCEEQRD